MLKYLIIQLCDTAPSFCHYGNGRKGSKLISADDLHAAVMFAMKENLCVQAVWPDYEIPGELKNELMATDHVNITPLSITSDAQISIAAEVKDLNDAPDGSTVVIRLSSEDIERDFDEIESALRRLDRLNVVLTDIEHMTEAGFEKYGRLLDRFAETIAKEYKRGHGVQFNLLTDRLLLDEMNNCNAGDESITVAPDGKFYICPAFYLDGSEPVGDLKNGLDVRNRQLYRLNHAPICRICDAWQCRRCVWLNKKSTLEVNTPGREQCVVSHIERNASRKLLEQIRLSGEFMPEKEISELHYVDPFEQLVNSN